MSRLTSQQTGPWLRALQAALQACAPNDDFVPMRDANAHLAALSPALGGDLLAPSDVGDVSGMPSLAWMTRATAEQALNRVSRPVSAAVREREPGLAARMEARSRLSEHLRHSTLLRPLHLEARVRRVAARTSAFLVFDHIDPGGHWVRTRVDMDGLSGQSDLGLVYVDDGSRIVTRAGTLDLFARHVATPIGLLHAALSDLVMGRISRLSRARIGPFWYPGGPCSEEAPEAVRQTLVLHLVQEVLAEDIAASSAHDPLNQKALVAPADLGAYRQRRLAVFRSGVPAVRGWLGADVLIHSFG